MNLITLNVLRCALLSGVLLATIAGCGKPAAPANLAGKQMSDADVTLKVNSALHQNASLQALSISVVTAKGDVRLTGEVASADQLALVVKIARDTEGVHSIHDDLTIKNNE